MCLARHSVAISSLQVGAGSINDQDIEYRFQALDEKKAERGVKVTRCGVETIIEVRHVVVGDIVLVEPGEIIPCDGVFLEGYNVKCDESSATGASNAVRKVSYEDYRSSRHKDQTPARTDCLMISGSKVLEGYGRYVVTAVGTKSFTGRRSMGTSSCSILSTSSQVALLDGETSSSHAVPRQRFVAIPRTRLCRRSSTILRGSLPSWAARLGYFSSPYL